MKKRKSLFFIVLLSLSLCFSLSPEFILAENDEESSTTDTEQNQEDEKNDLLIDKKTYTLEAYSTERILITVEGDGEVSFNSLDTSIVTVDDTGQMMAISSGKTKVSITLTPENEEEFTKEVTVEVLREDGEINFKKEKFYLIRDLYFDVDYSISGQIDKTEIIWESSNPSVAEVENGRVFGNNIGETIITASVRDISASMVVEVTVPLKDLEFNPNQIDMALNDEVDLPELVYVPYDTTNTAKPTFSVDNEEIVTLENGVLHAKKVGETTVTATINDIVTTMQVTIRPTRNERGADVIELVKESEDDNQITYRTPNIDSYNSNMFAVHLPVDEVLEFMKDKDEIDILIVLNDEFYLENMKRLDGIFIDKEIMQELKGKDANIHLLNQENNPNIIYNFNESFETELNLKYQLNEIEDSDPLYSLVNTKSYHLTFDNDLGLPVNSNVKIPAKSVGANYKQLHFVYRVDSDRTAIEDTNQEMMIDSQDYLNVEVSEKDYIITLSKVSTKDDSKVIIVLSVILVLIVLSGIGTYYYKTRYKK